MNTFLNFFITILATLSLSISAKDYPFPEYSKKMTRVQDCSCSGIFSACSGVGRCTCSCGFFTCGCSSSQLQQLHANDNVDISISEKQFNNIKLLADKLNELNAKKALQHLRNIVESVRDGDTKLLEESRSMYFAELHKLEQSSKNELNKFFKNMGAEEII